MGGPSGVAKLGGTFVAPPKLQVKFWENYGRAIFLYEQASSDNNNGNIKNAISALTELLYPPFTKVTTLKQHESIKVKIDELNRRLNPAEKEERVIWKNPNRTEFPPMIVYGKPSRTNPETGIITSPLSKESNPFKGGYGTDPKTGVTTYSLPLNDKERYGITTAEDGIKGPMVRDSQEKIVELIARGGAAKIQVVNREEKKGDRVWAEEVNRRINQDLIDKAKYAEETGDQKPLEQYVEGLEI